MPTDYGEPLAARTFRDSDDTELYLTTDRHGRSLFQMRDGPLYQFKTFRTWAEQEASRLRLVRCVNLLAGVPDADIDAALMAPDPESRLLALVDRLMAAKADEPDVVFAVECP